MFIVNKMVGNFTKEKLFHVPKKSRLKSMPKDLIDTYVKMIGEHDERIKRKSEN